MKAIVQHSYGQPEVLRIGDAQMPQVGDKDILVRVRAAGVDAGVWHLMAGKPYLLRLFLGIRKPRIPIRGRDLAGEVAAVGSKVTRFRAGDEVFGTSLKGAFSEFAVAGEDRLEVQPANLSFVEAAAIPTSACAALHAVRDAGQVREGQEVLIIGAGGGVGSFAVQLAKAYGAQVTAVCSTRKIELVRSLGTDHIVDYTTEDFVDRGKRYDVIVDIAGNNSLARLRSILVPEGTLVIVGGEGGGSVFGGLGRQLLAMVQGMFVRQRLRSLVSGEGLQDLRDLRELVAEGKIKPVVDSVYPLGDAPEAIRRLHAGDVGGKLVLQV